MSERIGSEHLIREAFVYVRQSSPAQVRTHTESARLQMGLCDKARALGWAEPKVIYDDLGVSAGGFAERVGFQKLVTEVSLLRVGIIVCFEASRLSRNSKDWAQLFELCGHVNTLVADLDQVYDLSRANDRLLLGIKGSVSEYEIALIRQRCEEASEAKARRGELQFLLPAGLTWSDGKIERTADRRIQQALSMVFDKFDELGSARQVLLWVRHENLQLPSRVGAGSRAVCWCKSASRHLDGELRVSLSRGRLTRWTRFGFSDGELLCSSLAQATNNSYVLFDAARHAGVGRIVHVSITHPSSESHLPYFSGKAQLESALKATGIPYSILRPAVLFGGEDILVNNIAWALRRFPLFGVPGDGRYGIRPIHVNDLAQLAIAESAEQGQRIVDAVGPETFTFRELVEALGKIIGRPRPVVSIPASLVWLFAHVVGRLHRDVFLTREEIKGLMLGLLESNAPATGTTRLTEWARSQADSLGRNYASEMRRRRQREVAYT